MSDTDDKIPPSNKLLSAGSRDHIRKVMRMMNRFGMQYDWGFVMRYAVKSRSYKVTEFLISKKIELDSDDMIEMTRDMKSFLWMENQIKSGKIPFRAIKCRYACSDMSDDVLNYIIDNKLYEWYELIRCRISYYCDDDEFMRISEIVHNPQINVRNDLSYILTRKNTWYTKMHDALKYGVLPANIYIINGHPGKVPIGHDITSDYNHYMIDYVLASCTVNVTRKNVIVTETPCSYVQYGFFSNSLDKSSLPNDIPKTYIFNDYLGYFLPYILWDCGFNEHDVIIDFQA